jgi:hypothetical protein
MQFSEDQIAEFQETFLLYDQRGDGRIPVSQIGKSRAKSTKMFRIYTDTNLIPDSDSILCQPQVARHQPFILVLSQGVISSTGSYWG